MGLAPDRSIIPNQAELNVAFLGCGMMLASDQSETNKPISLTALGCSQKLKSQRRKTALSVCCPNPLAIYYLLIHIFFYSVDNSGWGSNENKDYTRVYSTLYGLKLQRT